MPLDEALARRDRGEAVLVDVRSREAHAAGHIPGAVNVAVNEIEAQAPALRRTGRLPILYCG
jgi:rhodanese-related sulfurtransferase